MTKKKKCMIIGIAILIICFLSAGIFCFAQIITKPEKKVAQTTPIPVPTTTPMPTEAPTPTPTIDPTFGKVQSSITGEWISEKKEAKRPYAVMINNIEYAFLHQKGTSKADIIYEALAEGGITRMMAIFQDPSKVKCIGSVRSARHYYVQFAKEWNAIYCHFGQTKYATAKIEEIGVNNLSGLSAIGPMVYQRDSSVKPPHNVFTNGEKLKKGAKKLKYKTKQNHNKMAEHFRFFEKDTPLKTGKTAQNIILPFSTYSTSKLVYNAEKKLYYKYEYGQKHMDTYYNKQLCFKNIIVQLVEESNYDKKGYQTMELSNNSGNGYYICNGKMHKIRWTRNESLGKMIYKNSKGNILTINPGKTYIAVYPTHRKNEISIK